MVRLAEADSRLTLSFGREGAGAAGAGSKEGGGVSPFHCPACHVLSFRQDMQA